jgi:hypothetical protein
VSTGDLPLAVSTAPIRAVKAVEVVGRAGMPRIHPAGRYWRDPVEHRRTDVATCRRTLSRGTRRGEPHVAPEVDCSCGFHGVADLTVLREVMCVHADMAVLDVDLSGRVVEHELGWRAARQRILGAHFHDRCQQCGEPARVLLAEGRWRPLCAACGLRERRRGRSVLTCADATAALGVDVGFAPLPVEDRRTWRHWRLLGAVALLVAVVCTLALALVVHAPGSVLGVAVVPVAASAAALARLWTARGSRPAPMLISVQCWAITGLAVLTTAYVLRA